MIMAEMIIGAIRIVFLAGKIHILHRKLPSRAPDALLELILQ
jgi:hypothetical protein